MGFSRQEYWCGLPYPSPGDLPDPGIEPTCLTSPALAGGFFTTSTTWNYSRTIQTKPQRMMPSRCCSQHVSKSGRLSSGHRTGKGQSSSQFPRRAVLKNVQTTGQLHSSMILIRSCFKILRARLPHYMNQEPLDIQVGFRNGRGTRDQIANIHCIIEKAREFQKNINLFHRLC